MSDTAGGFMIADDGDGLSDELAEALFQQNRIADEQRGGLGLLIVERVVRGHGWTIQVDSDDEGTTFTIGNVVTADEKTADIAV